MGVLKAELPETRVVFIANCDIDPEIIACMNDEGERLDIEVVNLAGIDKQADHPTVFGMEQICDQVFDALENK